MDSRTATSCTENSEHAQSCSNRVGEDLLGHRSTRNHEGANSPRQRNPIIRAFQIGYRCTGRYNRDYVIMQWLFHTRLRGSFSRGRGTAKDFLERVLACIS